MRQQIRALVAIENDQDARLILKAIKDRDWGDQPQFILVHVVEDKGEQLWQESLLAEQDSASVKEPEAAIKMLDNMKRELESALPGTILDTCVIYGPPAEEILEAMLDKHPNVLIIGTHCRTSLQPILRTSISRQITREMPSSVGEVLIVPIPDSQTQAVSKG